MRHSESTAVFVSAKNWNALMDALPTLKSQIRTVIFWGAGSINEQVEFNDYVLIAYQYI